jgi:hypothetical protein
MRLEELLRLGLHDDHRLGVNGNYDLLVREAWRSSGGRARIVR